MRTILPVLLGAVIGLCITLVPIAVGKASVPVETADSVVKLKRDQGHGSAVHIGNGLYLTAAHVTKGADGLTIKTTLGEEIAAIRHCADPCGV